MFIPSFGRPGLPSGVWGQLRGTCLALMLHSGLNWWRENGQGVGEVAEQTLMKAVSCLLFHWPGCSSDSLYFVPENGTSRFCLCQKMSEVSHREYTSLSVTDREEAEEAEKAHRHPLWSREAGDTVKAGWGPLAPTTAESQLWGCVCHAFPPSHPRTLLHPAPGTPAPRRSGCKLVSLHHSPRGLTGWNARKLSVVCLPGTWPLQACLTSHILLSGGVSFPGLIGRPYIFGYLWPVWHFSGPVNFKGDVARDQNFKFFPYFHLWENPRGLLICNRWTALLSPGCPSRKPLSFHRFSHHFADSCVL